MALDLFEKITKFNPSVIYFFEPEPSDAQLYFGSQILEDTFMYRYAQTQDLIQAYFYAQEHMLPDMIAHREGKKILSVARFLEHIQRLHYLACQHMLSDEKLLGVYNKTPTFRWQYGSHLNGEMLAYFSGVHEAKTREAFSDYLYRYFSVEPDLSHRFIDLLSGLQDDKSFEDHPIFVSICAQTEEQYYLGISALMKLYLAYYTPTKLTQAQRNLVESMVLPCLPPENIPLEMEKYANFLLLQMRSLNMLDEAGVCAFLAEAFYQLTSIHPFINGNGRVAICLTNLLLVAIGLPSIVIRMPGDAQSPSSAYTKAFLDIDHSRDLLTKLMQAKLEEAKTEKILSQAAYDLCFLRLRLMQALQGLQAKAYPINDLFKLGDFPLYVSPEFCRERHPQELAKIQLNALLHQANLILNPQPALYKLSLLSTSATEVAMPKQPSAKDIDDLKRFLHDLSGLSSWKYSYRGGDQLWLKVDSLVQAKTIKQSLMSTIPDLRVQVNRVKQSDDYVVLCRGMDVSHYLAMSFKTEEKSRILSK